MNPQKIDDSSLTLEKLGLSSAEAKILLKLFCFEWISVADLAKVAGIARPDCYRLLHSIVNKGLAEADISSPVMYKAIPLKKACQVLLNRKSLEYFELGNETTKLIDSFERLPLNRSKVTRLPQFIFVPPSKKGENHRGKELIEKSKKSIDMIKEKNSLIIGFPFFEDAIDKALKRGVKIRIITDSVDTDPTFESIKKRFNSDLLKIHFLPNEDFVELIIYDEKEAVMSGESKNPGDFSCGGMLLSNNGAFLELIRTYFKEKWNKTQSSRNFNYQLRVKN